MSVRTFSDLPYVRPNLDQLRTIYADLTQQMQHATSAEAAISVVDAWNTVRIDVSTMASLA